MPTGTFLHLKQDSRDGAKRNKREWAYLLEHRSSRKYTREQYHGIEAYRRQETLRAGNKESRREKRNYCRADKTGHGGAYSAERSLDVLALGEFRQNARYQGSTSASVAATAPNIPAVL